MPNKKPCRNRQGLIFLTLDFKYQILNEQELPEQETPRV